ncbi:MAG: hypothetical protein H0V96_03325, partial [Acidimicrobiia bacterium]|nr:hypothetical protein [Acidimicrobiia bacterium]
MVRRGAGKSRQPPPRPGRGPGRTLKGPDADRAIAQASRRRLTRSMLERRNAGFERVSPEVGRLDETALGELIGEDLDAAAALLADLSVAVDDRLRSLAQALAARTFIRLAAESGTHREARRLIPAPYEAGGDLDLDRTLDRSEGLRPRHLEELVTRAWGADRARIVLLVDRSGSMSGGAVARAATAAAAIALGSAGRAACGVVAFAR